MFQPLRSAQPFELKSEKKIFSASLPFGARVRSAGELIDWCLPTFVAPLPHMLNFKLEKAFDCLRDRLINQCAATRDPRPFLLCSARCAR